LCLIPIKALRAEKVVLRVLEEKVIVAKAKED
jgi:hypothetical protein